MLGDMAQASMQLPPDIAAAAAQAGGAAAAAIASGGAVNAASLTDADREAAVDGLWTVLSSAEADTRSRADSSLVYPDGAVRGPGGGAVAAAAVTHLSDTGFFEGAFRSDFVRGWVRAFKTGAAHLPGGVGALAEVRAQLRMRARGVGEPRAPAPHERLVRVLVRARVSE